MTNPANNGFSKYDGATQYPTYDTKPKPAKPFVGAGSATAEPAQLVNRLPQAGQVQAVANPYAALKRPYGNMTTHMANNGVASARVLAAQAAAAAAIEGQPAAKKVKREALPNPADAPPQAAAAVPQAQFMGAAVVALYGAMAITVEMMQLHERFQAIEVIWNNFVTTSRGASNPAGCQEFVTRLHMLQLQESREIGTLPVDAHRARYVNQIARLWRILFSPEFQASQAK